MFKENKAAAPCPTSRMFNANGSGREKAADGFDYMTAVAEIYGMFPKARDLVHFYDLTARRFIEPDTAGAAEVRRYMQDVGDRMRFMKHAEEYRAEGNSAVIYGLPRGRCVMLTTSDRGISLLGKDIPAAQNVYFVLDHELGHVLAEHGGRGSFSRTMHECVADSFAALRHMQRFGTSSPAVDALLLHRAQRLVSLHGPRHAEHFTSFTLEKVLEIKEQVDVARLTPQQTLDLATRIAVTQTPNDLVVEKTAAAFKSFQDALEKGEQTALNKLAYTVLNTRDYGVFKWGAPVLRGYMTGKLGDMTNRRQKITIPKTDFTAPYWQQVSRMLTRKEFAFAKQDILYGMNLPKPSITAQSSNDNRHKPSPAP